MDRAWFRRATEAEIAAWREASGALPASGAGVLGASAAAPPAPAAGDASSEWHSEENTQRLLVERLRATGWRILRTANTATGEHGIDVIAERDGQTLGIEVKGYPSKYYVKGPMKGQVKASHPNNQATKWYAHAIVPAMKLRGSEPSWRSVMAFPDFPIYRRLHADTASALGDAGIEVWLVSQDGSAEALG